MAVKLEVKSKRCVVIRLKIKGMWITFIPVYGLTYDMDKEAKEAFYVELQGVVDKVPIEVISWL